MTDVDISEYSVPIWILKHEIKTEKSIPFEFKNHFFLFDIARDMTPEQVFKKCGQIGVSVLLNLKVWWLARFRKISSIYTMPSDSDVEEFSKTKTDPIFQANQSIRDSLTLNNTFLKEVNGIFIYFKGTRSKSAPISTTTDILIHDEKDRSDMKIIEGYQSRITASEYRWTWAASNPSQYNAGVDIDWQRSDKKEWFIRCLGCNEKQYLTWEDNVDETKKIFICKNCKRELTDRERAKGIWEKTGAGDVSGYHISQLMAPWISADYLIQQKNKVGIEVFRNFNLGEPYSAGDTYDFSRILLDNWTNEAIDGGQLYMGVDVGKIKHWVLGSDKGIFKIGKCERREELEEIIGKYKPLCVIDSGPERTWAEEFRNKFPNVWICFYQKDRQQQDLITWGGMKNSDEAYKKLGYVWVDRNRNIDDLVYNMQRGEIQFRLYREDMEQIIAHFGTMRRVERTNALSQKIYEWETTNGVNHFASALWFYWIARKRSMSPVEIVPELKGNDRKMIEATSEGYVMRDLKEVMEEINQ